MTLVERRANDGTRASGDTGLTLVAGRARTSVVARNAVRRGGVRASAGGARIDRARVTVVTARRASGEPVLEGDLRALPDLHVVADERAERDERWIEANGAIARQNNRVHLRRPA